MVVADTLFYTAIGPLVPLLAEAFALSKAEVGVMGGAFGLGAIGGSVLSAYLVGRIGVRPVAIAGLLALSAASLTFGFADGFWALTLARLGAGVSSALSWGRPSPGSSPPRPRRGGAKR